MENREVDVRKKKALMVMPLLVVPFLALFFWVLEGGKGKSASEERRPGLNLSLPSAVLDEGKAMNKLSLYEQAKRDSLKKREAAQNDPFSEWIAGSTKDDPSAIDSHSAHEGNIFSGWSPQTRVPNAGSEGLDPNQAAMEAKLAELEKLLADSASDTLAMLRETGTESLGDDAVIKSLDSLMQATYEEGTTEDPELARMDDMLSKILDIQHPERVKDRSQEASRKNKGKAFPVQTSQREDIVHILLPPPLAGAHSTIPVGNNDTVAVPIHAAPNRFYDLTEETAQTPANNAITAVVHDTRTLISGAGIKFRLTQDIYLGGTLIPKGSFVYGTSSLSGERLTCQIDQIHYQEAVFPVSLKVYDATDGLEGIYMPGAIGREAAKKGTDDAIQSLGLATLDPNIGTQAAAAGIETAKSFLSKKTKLIRVTVKADHPVLLVDDRAQN